MSQIADLIAEHCPDGVDTKALGEAGEFTRGRRFTKEDYVDEGLGAIHYGEIYTHFGTAAYQTMSFVRPELKSILRLARPGDLVIAATGENVRDVCKAVAWLGDNEIAVHDDCYIFRHELDPKYVSYFFQSSSFQDQKVRFTSESKVVRVSGANMAKIKIPVPPLAVQGAIVSVLETMERLRNELETELALRTRQYSYYAHVLLESGEDIPRVRLGDVATIVRGASPRPIQSFICAAADGVPWIKIGDVPAGGKYITGTAQHVTPAGAAKSRRVRSGDFVLSNSMSFGRPYISKIDGCIHDGWLAISDFEDSFDSDYLYYLLRSAPAQAEFARRARAGTVKNLNADIVKSVLVPLPSRERQQQVVELLDRFDSLVNDPRSGIPAELRGRRMQYEHYRDRLLTFEEAVA